MDWAWPSSAPACLVFFHDFCLVCFYLFISKTRCCKFCQGAIHATGPFHPQSLFATEPFHHRYSFVRGFFATDPLSPEAFLSPTPIPHRYKYTINFMTLYYFITILYLSGQGILPSSAQRSASAGLRWSLLLFCPTHPPGKVPQMHCESWKFKLDLLYMCLSFRNDKTKI